MVNRRSFITGLIAFAAAPAIVRASSLMPVKVMRPSLIYANRVIRSYMDFRVVIDRNHLLRFGDWDGSSTYRGIPIIVSDLIPK